MKRLSCWSIIFLFCFASLFIQGTDSSVMQSRHPQNITVDDVVTEVQALFDYDSGLVFYKDLSIPACLVESWAVLTESEFFMLPVPSKNITFIKNENVPWPDLGLHFCGNLPIYNIYKDIIPGTNIKTRKKRQTNGYYRNAHLGEARAHSDWNPNGAQASQAQVQGQVFGSGIFSGQAQTQNGGVSQSQVQLSGMGIRGQIASSSGNAQAQLAVGNGAGSGQASGLGHGPSSSQVQVSLGQQGEETMASASATSGGAAAGITGGGPGVGFGSGVPGTVSHLGHSTGMGVGGHAGRPGFQDGFYSRPGHFAGSSGVHGDDGRTSFMPHHTGITPGHAGAGQHQTPQVHHLQQPDLSGMRLGNNRLSSPGGLRNGYYAGTDRKYGEEIGAPARTVPITGFSQHGQTAGVPFGTNGHGQRPALGYGPGITTNGLGPSSSGVGSNLPHGSTSGAGVPTDWGRNGLGHYQGTPGFGVGSSGVPGSRLSPTSIAGHGQSGVPPSGTIPFQTTGQSLSGVHGNSNGIRTHVQPSPDASRGQQPTQFYTRGYPGGASTLGSGAQSSTPGAYAAASGIGQAQAQTVYFGYSGNGQIVPIRYEQSSEPRRGTSIVNGVRRYQDQQVGPGAAGQRQELQNGYGSGATSTFGADSTRRINGLRNGHTIYPGVGSDSSVPNVNGVTGRQTTHQLHTGQQSPTPSPITGGGLIVPQQTTVTRQEYGRVPSATDQGQDGTGILSTSGVTSQQPGTTHTTGYTNGLGGVGHTPTGLGYTSTLTNQQHGPRQVGLVGTNGHQATYQQTVNGFSSSTHGQSHIPGTTSTSTLRNGQAYRINGYGQIIPAGQPRQTVFPTTTTITGGGEHGGLGPESGQDGFSPSYGVSRPTPDDPEGKKCTIITFSCTIVVESNGRAKICRPNAVKMNGNGGSSTQNGTGSKVCCC